MRFSFKQLTYIWAIIILALSLTPGDYVPPLEFELLAPDTIAHVVFYLVLNYLILKWQDNKGLTTILVALIVSCGYGYVIELIQGNLIPGRFYDLGDVWANGIGAVFGLITFLVWPQRTKT